MSDSMIRIGDKVVPLASLSKEEKSNAWAIMASRISESITDYVNRHPEDYETVAAALKWAKEHAW